MAFILVKVSFITYHLRMSFAENLRDELEYQGIQVKELAEKTGLSINTLNKYRPGSTVLPTIDNALKIAQVLNVSLDYLATGKFMSEEFGGRNEIIQIYKRMRKFSDSDIRTVKSVVDSLSEKYR